MLTTAYSQPSHMLFLSLLPLHNGMGVILRFLIKHMKQLFAKISKDFLEL